MRVNRVAILEIFELIEFRWSAFAIYSVASIFSVSLRLEGFKADYLHIKASLFIGMWVTTFTLLLLLASFKILNKLREQRGRCQYGVLLLLPLVGAIRGVALYLAIDSYGLTNRVSIVNSTISSLLYTSIYYGGASLFVNLLLRKNRQFRNEFQHAAFYRLKRELESSQNVGVHSYEATMDQINRAINSRVIDVSAFNQEQMKKVSEEIRFQIQNFLRPLSHRLLIDSFGEIRTGDPKEILRDALIELRFSKKFMVCYQFFIGIFGIGITLGLTNGILKSFIATSASFLLFSIFDKFRHEMQVQSAASSIILLLLVGTIPGFASESICLLINRPSDFLASAIIGPALPAIIFLSAVYGIVFRDKEFALSAAKSIREVEANNFGIDAQSKKSRELSEYLHNSLQSELLRISKQLELNKEPEKTSILLDELNLALSRTRAEIDDLRSKGLERLSAVCLAWEGIATVQLQTLELGKIDDSRLGRVASVVEEIISNSIRYGNANEISIRLVGRGIFVDVSVTHNGTGIVTAGEGLGSLSILLNSETIPVLTKNKTGITLELTI